MSFSLPVLQAADYLALPKQADDWLLKPLLPAGGSMILYGDPKVGKSYAALQLALTLTGAGKKDWLGFPLSGSGRVVYVQLDTPRSLWAERLEALKLAGHPIDALHLADRETLETWPFDILREDHENLLRSALAPIKPVAVIIDTLKESNTGEENSSTEMQKVIAKLTSATQPAALILISHSRKGNPEFGPDLMSDQRGSGYVVGKMDAICRMSKKALYYTGRAIEEGSIKLDRAEDGFWEVHQDLNLDGIVAGVLADASLPTLRAKARELAVRAGIKEEAARSMLRRKP